MFRRTRAMPSYMCGAFLLLIGSSAARGQTTAFTYQGDLTIAGTAADGNYDLQFALFDAATGGGQIGAPQGRFAVPVTHGLFTVTLDFGVDAFPGANRFLQIGVRPAGSGSFTTLSPRQQISSAPYAIRTLSAATADALSGVQRFGAAGDATADDTAAIQAAIDAAGAAGGGTVFFPPGRYRTTQELRVSSSYVSLAGVGGASVIAPAGNFDTIRFESTSPGTYVYGNQVFDLLFDESAKTGGRLFTAAYVANFILDRVVADGGFSGATFDNFNNVTLQNLRVTSYRGGPGAHYVRLAGGSGGTGRSDVGRLTNCVFGGARSTGMVGLDIDGFVHTVNGLGVHFVDIGGRALWARNAVGAVDNPSFLTFTDLETDFPDEECIRLDAGQLAHFNNAQVNGSRGPVDNIYVGEGFRSVSFTGGFSSGAQHAGIAIAGKDVTLVGMQFRTNSNNQFGGSLGTYPGILIGSTARNVVVSGCTSGRSDTANYQNFGCQVDTGADEFNIVGNSFRGNINAGINNGAGVGASKLIANNLF